MMKAIHIMKKFIPLALLLIANPVFAQDIEKYLGDTSDAAFRIEIMAPQTEPLSLWQKMKSFIGVRAPNRVRPAIGTQFTVSSSAYAPSPYQTDATPCTTAVGTKVRPGVVASNFLPIGTVLDINGERYIVEDRMSARYQGYFLDVWFPSTSSALEFGRKKLEITVIGYAAAGTDVRKVTDAININEPNEITLWQSVKEGVGSLRRFLSARVNPGVDRYDVDCLGEETQ